MTEPLTVPGCPRHPDVASRECRDVRCTRTWKVEGAPTPDEQLARWVAGDPVCPNEDHECCPDFSCCKPSLLWPEEKRKKFAEADQGTREKMMMGALGAAIDLAMAEKGEAKKVYITRGVPEDDA